MDTTNTAPNALTLYRAADDGYASQGTSFAETIETARAYLDNPGFGGQSLWSFSVAISDETVLDLTGMGIDEAAETLGLDSPGAIGVDEWLPRASYACDAAHAMGYRWARVDESFPEGTVTWIWLGSAVHGDIDPEGEQIAL